MAKVHFEAPKLTSHLEAETGQATGWHGCGAIRLALNRGRGRLVPIREGHPRSGRRREPPDRAERSSPAAPALGRERREAWHLYPPRRPHRSDQLDQRHGGRGSRGRGGDFAPQPGHRHQGAPERRVGSGDREGHHRCRACGERRRLFLRPGAADGRPAPADHQHDSPVPGDRNLAPGPGAGQRDPGGARPTRLLLLPPGAEVAADRPLREGECRGLGPRRHRLGLRHGAPAAGPRPPRRPRSSMPWSESRPSASSASSGSSAAPSPTRRTAVS